MSAMNRPSLAWPRLRVLVNLVLGAALLPAFWVLLSWRDEEPMVFGVPTLTALPFALLAIAALCVITLRTMRCPACGTHLAHRAVPKRCPGCEIELR
jgi:hypothetical protein